MKNYNYIPLLWMMTAMGVSFSCKKNQELLYADIARLQFGMPLKDTLITHSFVYQGSSVKIDTVYINIFTMGDTSGVDRPFKIKQVQEKGVINAIPNVHYRSFEDPGTSGSYVIKAGRAQGQVPVILLRDASLTTQSTTLKFEIEANEHFQLGQENLLWRKIIITDQLSKPPRWDSFYADTYFGKYSMEKHRFFIDVTGQKWDQDFISMIVADTQQLQYWMGMIKSALVAYNKIDPTKPKRDENEELIVIP